MTRPQDFPRKNLNDIQVKRSKRHAKNENAIPEVPQAVTLLGDVWQIGPHRVICGDSTNPNTIQKKLFAGKTTPLVFTSPPYDNQRSYQIGEIKWTDLMKEIINVIPAEEITQVLINLGMIHRKHEWQPYWQEWLNWIADPQRPDKWRRFGLYIWDQGTGLPGDWNGRFAPAYEFLFHFNRKERRPNKIVPCTSSGAPVPADKKGGLREKNGIQSRKWTHAGTPVQQWRIPDNVVRINRQATSGLERGHPAVFPVGLPEFIIKAYSEPGDIVYEPFAGSGSTLIAAENTGRVCYASELAPEYVDLICRRYMRMFPNGPKPTLQRKDEPIGDEFYLVADLRGIKVPDDAALYRIGTGTKRQEEINTLEEFL